MIMLTLVNLPQTDYSDMVNGLQQFLTDNSLNPVAVVRGRKNKDHLHVFLPTEVPIDIHGLKGMLRKAAIVPDGTIGHFTANHEWAQINLNQKAEHNLAGTPQPLYSHPRLD